MSCKTNIIKLMQDNKSRTAYGIFKELNYSYGTIHRYIRELVLGKIIFEVKRTTELPVKIYYKLK